MEMILYTIAALLLYAVSDYILNTIEIKLQKRLPNRSLVFFVIIAVLSVSSFAIIRITVYKESDTTQATTGSQDKSASTTSNLPQTTQPQMQSQPAASNDVKAGN